MIASLVLTALLLVILGFYGLVRLQVRACESGVYYAPLNDAEEWSASLDVALGLSWLSDIFPVVVTSEVRAIVYPKRPTVRKIRNASIPSGFMISSLLHSGGASCSLHS